MPLPQQYLDGVRLFNEQEFWHAHEQWEACWLRADEPSKTFYQGLIQLAAALVHDQRGNLRGMQRNWAKARPRLLALPAHWMGIALLPLITAMDHYVLAEGTGPPPMPTIQSSPQPVVNIA